MKYNYLSEISLCTGNFHFWQCSDTTHERIYHKTEVVLVQWKQFYVELFWTGEHVSITGLYIDKKLLYLLCSVTEYIFSL